LFPAAFVEVGELIVIDADRAIDCAVQITSATIAAAWTSE
jgi:hypothetical protein